MPPLHDVLPLQDVQLDHVAVAVADLEAAQRWWSGIGGAPVAGIAQEHFCTEQLRLAGGGKVELIAPPQRADGSSFVDAFLARFGSGTIHHITLKVRGPLAEAVERLQGAGLDVVDLATADAHWHEGFLRPSQVGGLIIQMAWASGTDEDFARRAGRPVPAPPRPDAPVLRQVLLGHPDPDSLRGLWTLLGADVTDVTAGLVARWAGSPVAVRIVRQASAGPIGLVLDGMSERLSATVSDDEPWDARADGLSADRRDDRHAAAPRLLDAARL